MRPAVEPHPIEQVAGGGGAEHEIDPHGHNEQKNDGGGHFHIAVSEKIRHGIAEKKADDRIQRTDDEGHENGIDVGGGAEKSGQILKSKMPVHVGEGVGKDQKQGDDHEQDHKDPVGQRQPLAGELNP